MCGNWLSFASFKVLNVEFGGCEFKGAWLLMKMVIISHGEQLWLGFKTKKNGLFKITVRCIRFFFGIMTLHVLKIN